MAGKVFWGNKRVQIVALMLLTCLSPAFSQQKSDSSRLKNLINRFRDNKTAKRLMQNFKRRQDTIFNVKSEDPYIRYEGKIIRHIVIERIGFEKNIIDTAHTIFSMVVRTGNKLHNTTKEWVIRNNLFVREGKPLNSYRVADNERYLRDLDFILDSRIFVKPVAGSRDSVDLLVITRDVFSLGGSFNPGSVSNTKFGIQEANLGGMGQRLQYSGLFDNTRNPKFGSQFLYRKNNVFGSFVNATLLYSTINNGSLYGTENEKSWSLDLMRPLFMPYTRWAGGVTLSRNRSSNVFHKPDSTFERYRYNVQDYWIGYSFGHHKKLKEIRENRNRKFISARAFQQHYTELPIGVPLTPIERLLYQNRTTLLGQITFFRQDFYKTRFVLGFGRTEDVPYGYRFSFTGGLENAQGIKRPYVGAEIYRNIVYNKGSFFTYTLRLASFYQAGRSEDALVSLNITRYSRIYRVGETKVRHQLDVGYAQQFNQSQKRPLDINDVNGIIRFRPDSLLGNRRMNVRSETIFYTPWKLLGFNIAPLARIELAFLSKPNETVFQKKNFFTGLSGGFRVRNENLIFNTIEARAIYYPKTVEGISHVGFNIQANIRIKYPTILVSAPATVYN